MTDNETSKEGTSTREWEVVSLTASAYAAAPDSKKEDSRDKELDANELNFSQSMFMSGHFVFPPSEHENLPLASDLSEVQSEAEVTSHNLHPIEDEVGGSDKAQETWSTKNLIEPNEVHQAGLFEKGRGLYVHGMTVEQALELQSLSFVGEEHSLYNDNRSTNEAQPVSDNENTDNIETENPSQNLDPMSDVLKDLKPIKVDEYSRISSESWWKRQAASLYAHAKETDAFWSIVIAAALMGLVILGQRWQRESWRFHQLKWKLSNADEKLLRVFGPISRFKDVLIGSPKRGLAGIASAEH